MSLRALTESGVSIWLDDLSRARLISDSQIALSRLVQTHLVSGVTTNPSIFAAAVKGSDLYRDAIRQHPSAEQAIRDLTCTDVQMACDVMKPVFDQTYGVDGRVSIEVDPRLAHQTEATVQEGRELWDQISRENLLIKVPATKAGLPAIRQLIAEGISVNVTLIFSLAQYRDVVAMYQAGIADRTAQKKSIDGISSVASFFVSRMDTEIDKRLDQINSPAALELKGQAGIANARLAYKAFEELFAQWSLGPVQRPLWASTGVKNPAYSDTMYVDQLVAPSCVNTMPENTLRAAADHGHPVPNSASSQYDHSSSLFDALASLGIQYDDVVEQLEREGVSKFLESWEDLIATVNAAMG